MAKWDLVVHRGQIVLESGIIPGDLAISGDKIDALSSSIPRGQAKVDIDAANAFVLPGIIDMHTHFGLRVADGVNSEGFETGTRAAVRGGITTIVDFADQTDRGLLDGARLRMQDAVGQSHCDYGFHIVITHFDKAAEEEMPVAAQNGYPTFKLFTCYRERGMMSGDGELLAAMRTASACGATILIHAENEGIIERLSREAALSGDLGVPMLGRTRPAIAEAEAISRVGRWALESGAPAHVVHVSSMAGAREVAESRRNGSTISGETCPQYLLLDDSAYLRPDAHLYTACPPLRTERDNQGLWNALGRGDLQILATDTCGFTRSQKDRWGGDFRKAPFGVSSVEVLLPAAFTFGVCAGRFGMARLVQLLCSNPAQLNGLYPRKGTLVPGSDAAFILLDPGHKEVFGAARHASGLDHTPYEGMELAGFPRMVVRRGRVLVDDYGFMCDSPSGAHLQRPPRDALRPPALLP